jgi:hypothetical protein
MGDGLLRSELARAMVMVPEPGADATPQRWERSYRHYERLADDVLLQRILPESDRRLVQRYFELIRPASRPR